MVETSKIEVKVHPNSSQEKIKEISEDKLEIWTKERAEKGKANNAILKLLKKHFKGREINDIKIKILKGVNSKNKTIEIK